MIVMKFGGTSTQDAAAMSNVARIVRTWTSSQPLVVISAIARATNSLERIGSLAVSGSSAEANECAGELLDRHRAIVDELIGEPGVRSDLHSAIESAGADLQELISGISILGELTPKTLDKLYSFGELLSSRLVAGVLVESGVPAVWKDTVEFMVTDSRFNAAVPLMDHIEVRVNAVIVPEIMAGKTVVTQGFIGVTQDGKRTTMGRESSDYSAAILASALRAEDVQIWTDVDGILTADPTIVPSPKKLKSLSFSEAYELSYLGAKVLHPGTMLPALERNIPIHIYNSRHPHRSGSLVANTLPESRPVAKSIACRRRLARITISPHRRLGQFLFWEEAFNILVKHSVVPRMTATSEYSLTLIVDQAFDRASVLRDLGEIGAITITEDLASISVVGNNVAEIPRIGERILRSILPSQPLLTIQGVSQSSLTVIVGQENIGDSVRQLHAEFFERIDLPPDLFEDLEN